MKPFVPYNILLALSLVVMGATVFYNFVLRESFATTLQYSYPVVEQREVISEQPPAEQPPPASAVDEPSAPESVHFPLDLNSATEEQLKFIPRVGDVMAQRIVQYRAVLGGYTSLEQLRDIKGVGESTYEQLYAYLFLPQEDAAEEATENEG